MIKDFRLEAFNAGMSEANGKFEALQNEHKKLLEELDACIEEKGEIMAKYLQCESGLRALKQQISEKPIF